MHPKRTSTDLLTHTYYRDPYFDFTYVANQLVHVMKESFTFELSTHYMDCEMCYVCHSHAQSMLMHQTL